MKKKFILRNKSEIDNLFEVGKYTSNGIIMLKSLDSDSTKFLFAVSSKKFKRAVDRNRIKRMMKESVRDLNIIGKNIAIVYVGKDVPTFEVMNKNIKSMLNVK